MDFDGSSGGDGGKGVGDAYDLARGRRSHGNGRRSAAEGRHGDGILGLVLLGIEIRMIGSGGELSKCPGGVFPRRMVGSSVGTRYRPKGLIVRSSWADQNS